MSMMTADKQKNMVDDNLLPGIGVKVLISGGSIAGPSVAWWLNKYGFETTLVERWPELRPGGQNIDIRGVGRDIITQMGLFEAVKAQNTTEAGLKFVTASGRALATIPAFANGPTAELEVLRGDFAKVLFDATEQETRYIFGDYIVAIDDEEYGTANKEGKAIVTFNSGRKEDFDIVIIADGVKSRTRKLVFEDEVSYKRLGSSIAYATIPRIPADTPWWSLYTTTGRRSVFTRPDPHGTTRACLDFETATGFGNKDAQERIAFLRQKFEGAGWQTRRILDQLDETSELYCEDLVQVLARRYSSGRVVMVGDAAYCASPNSGMGTTLSLSGAHILASELALSPDDHISAFARYEEKMRPIATKAQDLPLFFLGLLHPETRLGLAIFQGTLAVLGTMLWAAMKVPWPKLVMDRVREMEEGKISAPEYEELQKYH